MHRSGDGRSPLDERPDEARRQAQRRKDRSAFRPAASRGFRLATLSPPRSARESGRSGFLRAGRDRPRLGPVHVCRHPAARASPTVQGCAPVAEHGPAATRERCRLPDSLPAQARVADREYAAMDPVQASGGDAPCDAALVDACRIWPCPSLRLRADGQRPAPRACRARRVCLAYREQVVVARVCPLDAPIRLRAMEERADDAAIVEALRRGDEATFARLVDELTPALTRLAVAHVPSRAVAEEVVQDTWLGVIRGID